MKYDNETIKRYSRPSMAQLKVISYTGNSFVFHLNKEVEGPANLDTIQNWLAKTGGELTWNPKQILLSGEDSESYFKWEGKFNISEDNQILEGSIVNKFERNLSDSRYGKISITGIEYDAKAEAGAFYALTVPDEIRDVLEQNDQGGYNSTGWSEGAYPGFTYNFQTPYDKGEEGSQAPNNSTSTSDTQEPSSLTLPESFNKKSADKITNFNPSTDSLEIDTNSFGIDSSATYASGASKKEVKKALAKQDFDLLYDQKKGGLYFNENGAEKGFGDGGIIAILKGAPDLTSGNLEFI